MLTRTSAALFFTLALILPVSVMANPAGESPVEIHTQEFYDGITVTTTKLPNGNFQALVATYEEDAPSEKGAVLRARYTLQKAARRGVFQVIEPGRAKPKETIYEYSRGSYPRALDDILDEHNVYSVSLSALLLWEDDLFERSNKNPLFDNKVIDFKMMDDDEVCPSCTASPNGCSPGWLVPDSCAGSSISDPCADHDRCYQCGGPCFGTSRLECDQSFRGDIINATGSNFCANVYYYGVRLLGWVFYNDPRERGPSGPDVYALGIEISACEGQYAHFCTNFVM